MLSHGAAGRERGLTREMKTRGICWPAVVTVGRMNCKKRLRAPGKEVGVVTRDEGTVVW